MKKCFLKVGKIIYSFSEKMIETEKLQLFLTTLFSFICVIALMIRMWPIANAEDLTLALFLIIFVMIVVICITRGVLAYILMFLSYVCEPLAMEYDARKKKKGEEKDKSKSQELGNGPKAEVGFKYFLELEKESSVYNAKFMGF